MPPVATAAAAAAAAAAHCTSPPPPATLPSTLLPADPPLPLDVMPLQMQRTPRLACLEDGDTALLARLLAEGGWDLRQPLVSKPDRMPLHIAASSGHLECMRMLLEAGADPRQMSSDGMDALACAVT